MAIAVYFFGSLTDITNTTTKKLAAQTSTDDLQQLLENEFPGLKNLKYFVAVNKKMIKENTVLQDGDTIAFMPAFSGG